MAKVRKRKEISKPAGFLILGTFSFLAGLVIYSAMAFTAVPGSPILTKKQVNFDCTNILSESTKGSLKVKADLQRRACISSERTHNAKSAGLPELPLAPQTCVENQPVCTKWEKKVDPGTGNYIFDQKVLNSGNLVFAFANHSRYGIIRAYNKDTGNETWSRNLDTDISFDDAVISSDGKTIFLLATGYSEITETTSPRIYFVSASNGTITKTLTINQNDFSAVKLFVNNNESVFYAFGFKFYPKPDGWPEYDYKVIKITASGAELWNRVLVKPEWDEPGFHNDKMFGVSNDESRVYLMCCDTQFGNSSDESDENTYGMYILLASNGQTDAGRIALPNLRFYSGLEVSSKNEVFVAGTFNDFFTIGGFRLESNKLSVKGTYRATDQYDKGWLNTLAVSPDGNTFAVAGEGDFTLSGSNEHSAVTVAAFDAASGLVRWTKIEGDNDSWRDWPDRLAFSKDGKKVYMLGYFASETQTHQNKIMGFDSILGTPASNVIYLTKRFKSISTGDMQYFVSGYEPSTYHMTTVGFDIK